MRIQKFLFTSLLAISVSSVSALAFAELVIINNTNQDSTSFINEGFCSSSMAGGVTKAKSTNKVDDTMVKVGCLGHVSDCKAEVYMTTDCQYSGASKIATVVIDAQNKTVKSIEMHNNDYNLTKDGYSFTLDGGPDVR